MRILAITAGAANMYCGSCLRDNALARELMRQGHDVTLVPIYTPTRTDEPNVSEDRVLYGGVNVYLQEKYPLFRRTPGFVDRLFDSKLVMGIVSRLSVSTDPGDLGDLTVSTLRGENGHQSKEVQKLVDWARSEPRPDVIVLPNSLMIGLAEPLGRELDAPVCCTLQGEDLFLDGLPPARRREALQLIRARVEHVAGFGAVSEYFAGFMIELLGIAPERVSVVPLGIDPEGYERNPGGEEPLKVGYFARIAPEKGLHNLVDAYIRLRRRKSLPRTALEVAGYLGKEHRGYLREQAERLEAAGLADEFRYHGTLDLTEKRAFLSALDVFSVPTDYEEPKGLFLLEAMAAGVPAVQPRRGAFPEILAKTGGGRLVEAGDNEALADGLETLLSEPDQRRALGDDAYSGVRRHFTTQTMAKAALGLYQKLTAGDAVSLPPPVPTGVLST